MKILLTIICVLVIACLGIGFYLFRVADNKTNVYQSDFEKEHPKELGDFPIYPQAKFVEKKGPIPCASVESGYSACGETLYYFRTNAGAADFYDFYHSENNGWVMSGGAGETDELHYNYSGESSFNKDELEYYLHFAASNGRVTDYVIGVPAK